MTISYKKDTVLKILKKISEGSCEGSKKKAKLMVSSINNGVNTYGLRVVDFDTLSITKGFLERIPEYLEGLNPTSVFLTAYIEGCIGEKVTGYMSIEYPGGGKSLIKIKGKSILNVKRRFIKFIASLNEVKE
jgi:hypothetical protein